MRSLAAAVLLIATAGCGSQAASIPAPEAPPRGSLLVLETQPCNWLHAPDPNKCDWVGLARIGLDGELLEELTPDAEPPMAMRSMALSHDRAAIAWTWNWELSVMGVDGDAPRVVNEKLLADNMGETLQDPTWAPDGTELLYQWDGATGEDTWYRVAVETGELTEVRMPVDCRAMAWAPGGTHLACEVWEESGERSWPDLYLVDLETLAATALTDPDDAIGTYRPDWSPDGRWLAFSMRTEGASAADDVDGIWILELETGRALRVAAGALSLPSWSPDGGHLAAFDNDRGRIVIVGRDGSGLTVLDHEPRRFVAPRWLPDE